MKLPKIDKKVTQLEEYCNKYNEWPVYVRKSEKSEKEIIGNRLSMWMDENNFHYGLFNNPIYLDLLEKEKEGTISFDEMTWLNYAKKANSLYRKYKYVKYYDLAIEIEDYCINHDHFLPGNSGSDQYGNLLYKEYVAMYNRKDFEFITDVDGNSIKEMIDNLRDYYSKEKIFMRRIINDTYKNGRWPVEIHNPNVSVKAENSQKHALHGWLNKTRFNADFLHESLTDLDGIKFIDKLDAYYLIFAKYKHGKPEITAFNNLDIWQAKASRRRFNLLYFYLVEIKRCIDNDQTNEYYEYKNELDKLTSKNDFGMNIEEIISNFILPKEELILYLTSMYYEYKDINPSLSELFQKLYLVTVLTTPPEEYYPKILKKY